MDHLFRKSNARVLLVACCVLISASSLSAQLPSQDPGSKHKAEVAGVTFSVPKGFKLEASSESRVAFMRHNKYDLALFVAVPDKVDDTYLTALSDTLVSQLFPKEGDFKWKLLPGDPESKVSRFEKANGATKGFNDKRFFQTHYITVEVNDRAILVGYITQLGQWNNDAKWLFEREGASGMSMPGWYAQAHILASITGEKYEQINPGTSIQATPIPMNND